MRQQQEVDACGIEPQLGGVLFLQFAPALEHAAVDQQALAGALEQVAGTGDVAVGAVEGKFHHAAPGPKISLPLLRYHAVMLFQIDAASSANQNSSASSGSMTPSSTRKGISTARRQIFFAHQHDRHHVHLARLQQRERLEQFIERAESAGERDQGAGALQEMKLAHREIVEAETQPRGDVGIRKLLVRQADIEPDARRTRIERAAVCRLHDAGAAAGHDGRLAMARIAIAAAHELPEFARDIVVAAARVQSRGDLRAPRGVRIGRRRGRGGARGFEPARRGGRLLDARAAKHDDGVADVRRLQQQLGFQVIELQARRAHVIALQENRIGIAGQIARARHDRRDARGRLRIIGGGLDAVPGERRAASRFHPCVCVICVTVSRAWVRSAQRSIQQTFLCQPFAIVQP